MKKYIKLALKEKQIEDRKRIECDGYEIQLLGDDDFELIKKLDKPVITLHTPLKFCYIDDFNDKLQKQDEYVLKMIEVAKENNFGIVLHAVNEDALEALGLTLFFKYLDIGINIHIENGSREPSYTVIENCAFLNRKFKNSEAFPLLDTCHHMITSQNFAYKELSLVNAVEVFESPNYKIHFADCIGDGRNGGEGKHGTNFNTNHTLMESYLKKFNSLEHKPDIIIEVSETNNDCACLSEDLLYHIKKAGY